MQPCAHQCHGSKYATGGLCGIRSTSPPLLNFFFIKGEGKETLVVPLGEAAQNYLPVQCPVEQGPRGQADTLLPLLLGLQISSC